MCRGKFKHLEGLNVPKNIDCEILMYSDRFEFKYGSIVFNSPISKMVDIS